MSELKNEFMILCKYGPRKKEGAVVIVMVCLLHMLRILTDPKNERVL